MSAQFGGADVLFLAAAALKGPLIVVLPLLVQLEVVCPAEPLLTYIASKRLLSRVESHVRLQSGTTTETFAANLARKGPFARVDSKMTLKVAQKSEPLLADFAFERPFPRVGPHMTIEVSQPTERLCAEVAHEVLLSVNQLQRVR